ncbi:MAG: glutamyl-tRNA amidotransferase [Gammaproteobacteria bacterium]|nr:glutamyl-tRNA amidotransferase [Gammaproteobacteria bacterium]
MIRLFPRISLETLPVVALLLAMISGCASTAEPIDPYVQQLQWLDAADPQADANQAVKQNDLRLLGLATRSVNIPGIDKKDLLKYEEVCGVQLIEGISDVVRSDEHLRLMQKARSYALKYNAIIKLHCKI